MHPSTSERTDIFIRYIRGTLYLALGFLGIFSVSLVAMAFDPDGTWAPRVALLYAPFPFMPLLIIFGVGLNARQLKGLRFRKDDPAVRAVLNDEQRLHALNKAFRAALIAVLVAQFPLALLFLRHPMTKLATTPQPVTLAPVFMGAFSLVLGVAALLGCFLYFDRE